MNSDRETLKARFLAAHGLGEARREPLAGDASTRAYERLYPAPGSPFAPSLIFMDQPPSVEAAPCPPQATLEERRALGFNAAYRLAAGRVDAFVACAGWLRAQGLSAPRLIAADPADGLAVLEDLGPDVYAPIIAEGRADEAALYDAAVDVLLVVHAAAAPAVLDYDGSVWPLLDYDGLALESASDIFTDWYGTLYPAAALDGSAIAEWNRLWTPIRARAEAGAAVFCLRDYHAENLIWLPDRAGPARVGLLDFQDAVRAHPAWDFSMLLHDARRDVSAGLAARCLDRYLAARPEIDRAQFLADFNALGALNIVRILGIFARLIVRDAKPRYAVFMPRLWRYLDACLASPGMEGLAAWFEAHVPKEARA
ncbi:MAG: aminoglycoside phosphotransferase [Caulobacter sp.]|nr:aminoglycoside phosphotransferase [Caulobacter sp.]